MDEYLEQKGFAYPEGAPQVEGGTHFLATPDPRAIGSQESP